MAAGESAEFKVGCGRLPLPPKQAGQALEAVLLQALGLCTYYAAAAHARADGTTALAVRRRHAATLGRVAQLTGVAGWALQAGRGGTRQQTTSGGVDGSNMLRTAGSTPARRQVSLHFPAGRGCAATHFLQQAPGPSHASQADDEQQEPEGSHDARFEADRNSGAIAAQVTRRWPRTP